MSMTDIPHNYAILNSLVSEYTLFFVRLLRMVEARTIKSSNDLKNNKSIQEYIDAVKQFIKENPYVKTDELQDTLNKVLQYMNSNN